MTEKATAKSADKAGHEEKARPLTGKRLKALLAAERARVRSRADAIAQKLPWKKKRAARAERRPVVLLPPLIVPSLIMYPLRWRLWRAGYRPTVFPYRSYRRDIPDNAAELAVALKRYSDGGYDVVAFSLGGILLRWALNHYDLPKPRRVVMMGPPNRGSFMADWLDARLRWAFPIGWGRCARQLRRGAAGLCDRAGHLPHGTELGVIAGGNGQPRGFNKLIPGDNDLTVAVSETVLPGMSDFTLVRLTHSLLPVHRRSTDLALRFLETGHFRAKKGEG